MAVIWLEISSVAFEVWLARVFDLRSIHGKVFGGFPGPSRSMVAFSASRLVCEAISLMSFMTSPIFPVIAARL